MRNFSFRIACSTDSVSSRKGLEAFSRTLISEIGTTRKSDQYDIRVDWIDAARLQHETHARHEAHQLSGGDSPVVATDAGSAIAYANGCLSIIACYDFFEDIERLARITDISAEQLRNRLYVALSHAQRIVIVGDEAQQMIWSYCPRDCHYVQMPPLSLYRSLTSEHGGTPLIVVHDVNDEDAVDNVRGMLRDGAGVPGVMVADADGNAIERVGSSLLARGSLPSGISVAIHLGRDLQSRPGMRLADFWASGIPIVQYVSERTAYGPGRDVRAGLVSDDEDGLLSTTFAELRSDIQLLGGDPVLAAVFARNAKAKVEGMRPVWLEVIQQGLFGDVQ